MFQRVQIFTLIVQVEHQIIWQLCAVLMLTLVIILLLYIASYISVAIFARIVIYIRFSKPHGD